MGRVSHLNGKFPRRSRNGLKNRSFLCHPGLCIHFYACIDGYSRRQMDSCTESIVSLPRSGGHLYARSRSLCHQRRLSYSLRTILHPLPSQRGFLYAYYRHCQLRGLQRPRGKRKGSCKGLPSYTRIRYSRLHLQYALRELRKGCQRHTVPALQLPVYRFRHTQPRALRIRPDYA